MLQHYLLSAFRNLRRNPLFSIINILGLTIGITAFVFILEYVGLESGVNKFHADKHTIYRLLNQDVKGQIWPETEPVAGPLVQERFPEIEEYCRIENGVATGIVQNAKKNVSFRESNIGYADGNMFTFFSFPLNAGNADALKEPNVVFLSETAVIKYFGKENPLEKNLTLHNQFGETNYQVKGVFAPMEASDIQYDMVFSLETLANPANQNDNDWADPNKSTDQYLVTYFRFAPNVNVARFEKKLTTFRNEIAEEDDGVSFRLQPLKNMHLASSLNDDLPTFGNLRYVYILGGIALLIILIAWFNYINLSTAGTIKRSKEIGVRKAIGASQNSVLIQFMVQTLLIIVIAFGLAYGLVILLQPYFNALIDKNASLSNVLSNSLWLYGAVVLLIGTLVSGLFAAGIMARFETVATLKGQIKSGKSGVILRKSLVVTQFSFSIMLILITVVIYTQLRFMLTQDVGFDNDRMLTIAGPSVYGDNLSASRSAFEQEVTRLNFVEKSAASGSIPGRYYNFRTSGFTHAGSKPKDGLKSYAFIITGENYLPTYGIPLKAGRNFTAAETRVEWNDNNKVIINETALREMNFRDEQDALLNGITWDERHLDIIGVMKDYHHQNLQNALDPIIMYPQNNRSFYTLKLGKGDLAPMISSVEKLYTTYFPGNPFDYSFVAENFEQSYAAQRQYCNLFSTASFLAIFIACLGLFGLATHTVETRTKEISVRKVLGASVFSVVRLLSVDFLKLIVIAAVISLPIAAYFSMEWLQDFAYRIDLQWWMFIAAVAVTLLIALLTVGFQSIKGALANPAKNLKSE
jgi:putative ABC transport system permease protein